MQQIFSQTFLEFYHQMNVFFTELLLSKCKYFFATSNIRNRAFKTILTKNIEVRYHYYVFDIILQFSYKNILQKICITFLRQTDFCFWGFPKCGYFQELSLSLNSPLSLCLRKFMFHNTKFEIISRETKTEFMWLSLRLSLRIFVNTAPGLKVGRQIQRKLLFAFKTSVVNKYKF